MMELNKMDMSLDEIILQEQKKKGILRTNCNDEEVQIDEEILDESPRVTMNSADFLPHHSNFIPRRAPGLSQHQWVQYRNINRFNYRRPGHIQKQYPPGIPLIKLKRGFRQGIVGNSNYKVRVWKQPKNTRLQTVRRFSGKSYPLTSNYLQQFDDQNRSYIPRRGPGSTASRGSLCSNCSRTSARSHTSYRSMRSNRSVQSMRTRSSNSRRSFSQQINRFNYFLNRRIQLHIQQMQENKALRVHNSSRENLIDEPSKCKPQPRHTWCSLHHRFKKFILNPIN